MNVSRRLCFLAFAAIFTLSGSLPAGAAAVKRPAREFVFPNAGGSAAQGVRSLVTSSAAIGSGNVATADAPVPRPNERPCIAPLFTAATFSQYAPQTFAYTPPVNCPGPYEEIVFNGNFAVSAGIQFDRTASVEIGNVPIFFGTTAEPSPTLSPSWHVERDVTDDAALLASPNTTEADIFNIVNGTYTGVISGTAFLQFYPARGRYAAADTPDVVLPFPGIAGGPQHLPTPTSTLSATYTLPTNVDRAYIDVYAQSQQTDEQYFLCAPTNVAADLGACPNGPLRETEISIDGTPAGVAPVYPWIYTGGLDPYLWAPIPGVQTLEFKPYRIDLSPFAGVLSNGKPHTVVMSVDNADQYFQGFATLFAYRDRGIAKVRGALVRDTLTTAFTPTVNENLNASYDGTISTTSVRNYTIAGYVVGSRGRVSSSVTSTIGFSNDQTYSNESATTGTTVVIQQTNADERSLRTSDRGGFEASRRIVSFPIRVSLAVVLDASLTGTQVASIDQHFIRSFAKLDRNGAFASFESNEVAPTDTLDIYEDASITGNSGQSSRQQYFAFDTNGQCYSQSIRAANSVLTAVSNAPCDRNAAASVLRSLSAR